MTHKNPQPSLNVGRQLDSNSRSVSYFQDLGLTFEHVCVGAERGDGTCRVFVVSVIVKRPERPPCVVDGRHRNPLYHYY